MHVNTEKGLTVLKHTRRLRSALGVLFAVAVIAVPAAHADALTYDFTANNTTELFDQPFAYSIFGTFTYDYSDNESTTDFFVQYPGAANGEFKLTTPTVTADNSVYGYDITGNQIILTFQNALPTTAGIVDPLIKVAFDISSPSPPVDNIDNSPNGGVCLVGTCPNGNAPTSPSAPEPASLAMLGGGLIGLGWLRRRKK